MKKLKAFTLIELLVVIVIIGILAALIVLSLTTARAKARDAKAKSAVSDTVTAVEQYINDNPTIATSCTTSNTARVSNGCIGSFLRSDAQDATGATVKFKIISQTQYAVVGLAAKTGDCWYSTAGMSITPSNNLSLPSAGNAGCTLAN